MKLFDQILFLIYYLHMKIYTKTGDKGETSLCDGKRVSKTSLRVHAYGDIDELSSNIGMANSLTEDKKLSYLLTEIQQDLFVLGTYTATPCNKEKCELPLFPKSKIEGLEAIIDELTKELPPLKNFILPGGTKLSATLHVARTVCRRAERTCVELAEKKNLKPVVVQYLNRLSDLLFVLARFANDGKDVGP